MKNKKEIGYLDLYFFSIRLGIKAVLKGRITKESIKRVLCPMDPARYYELPRVANALNFKVGKVLDVSSPKLLAYYLAQKYPHIEFFAIDKFEDELLNWDRITEKPKNLRLLTEDVTKLNFPTNFFDEIFSISVIEHVNLSKKRGDSEMMKEVHRVLKKGGRFVFTTIISNDYKIVYRDKNMYSKDRIGRKSFFCRIYNYKTLLQRVLKVGPFELVEQEVCNDRFPLYETVFNKLIPYSAVFGFLHLLFAPLMIDVTTSVLNIKNRAEYFAILVKK